MTERICEKCGIVLRDVHGLTKYCEFCKAEIKKYKTRERVKKHRENGNKEDKEQIRKRVERYRERWGYILKRYRYDAIGKAYEEHGKLMNQYYTGKGTNNFGAHADPDFDKELKYVQKEKQRRGI